MILTKEQHISILVLIQSFEHSRYALITTKAKLFKMVIVKIFQPLSRNRSNKVS